MCSSAPSERATRAPQSCAVSLRRLVARITAWDEHTISVVRRWPSREHNQGPPPGFKNNGWLKCDNATKTAWCMCACEMVASCATKYNDGVHNVLSRVTRPHDVSVHHPRSLPVNSRCSGRRLPPASQLQMRSGAGRSGRCAHAPASRGPRRVAAPGPRAPLELLQPPARSNS